MRIRFALPEPAIRPDVLDAALETSTRANEALLKSGATPLSHLIKRGKVKWRPEPYKDGEHFDLAPTVASRGWGDCDDLAPAIAAELRVSGRDPKARAFARRSGPGRWHAVVRRSSGEVIDPSVWAGMRSYKRGLRGSSLMQKLMPKHRGGTLGIRIAGPGLWAARCDLPLDGCDLAVSGLGLGRCVEDAVSDAVHGATVMGDASDAAESETLARALAIDAAMAGDDDELDGYEDDVTVGFLPIAAALAPTALNMAKGLLPGGKKGGGGGAPPPPPGQPAVSAQPAGGGAPVSITPYGPGGPIIVRF